MPRTWRILIAAAASTAWLSAAAAQEAVYEPGAFPAPATAGTIGRAWMAEGFGCMATNLTDGYDVTRTNIIDERIAVVRGELVVTVEGARYILWPGDAMYLPAGTRRHQTTADRPFSRIAFGYGPFATPANLCE